MEDLWVILSIANLCWGYVCEQIDGRSQAKIYEYLDQSRILVEDLHVKKLTANLSIRSMNKQISGRFLLRIYMWAELTRVLINQKAIAQRWLQWCISCSSCLDVDLRQIRATAKPDADLSYIKSPNIIDQFNVIMSYYEESLSIKPMKLYIWICSLINLILNLSYI